MNRDNTREIFAIYGPEPMREREYPVGYQVGQPVNGGPRATAITYYEQNLGDHGLGWFRVWAGDVLLAEMSARAVADIHYVTAENQ